MSSNYSNADSLLYLQECINDLQNRFYGLQLEHMQKQEQQKMLQQLPSLNNSSIWSTQSSNPYRPPSASSSTTSTTTAVSSDRDSGAGSSMRSFSPDISAASVAQLNAAAALWPQAAANALAAFMPKGAITNAQAANAAMLQFQTEQMDELFNKSKPKMLSPIGTGKPKTIGHYAHQHQMASYGNHFDHRAANHAAFPFNKNHQRKPTQKRSNNNHLSSNKQQKQQEKPKQGPFNKVLIVGLAPEYRSLNGVLDIFRPYGDVVSARVYRPFLTLPPEITRWVPSIELQGAYCAVIEYPTARCAKFAVGVLRERVTTNKYRVVLLKPGAYEELQRQQTLIQSAAVQCPVPSVVIQSAAKELQHHQATEEANSDSGNESFENRSSRSSDCHSD